MLSLLIASLACAAACGSTSSETRADAPSQCPPSPPNADPPRDSGQLTKQDVVDAMAKAKQCAIACFDHYHKLGMASVALTIETSGEPTDVHVIGELANDPEGTCIAAAVSSAARFRRFTGDPLHIVYPFLMR